MKLFKMSVLALSIGLSHAVDAAKTSGSNVNDLLLRTEKLEKELTELKYKQQLRKHKPLKVSKKQLKKQPQYISTTLSVHTLKDHPDLVGFHPSALMAGDYILTYIAGMPVVTSPYLGSRPAFDGSDLIVNISSINQDVRLMMQRNAVARALAKLGYPEPDTPIIALSGAIESYAWHSKPYGGPRAWDLDLGTAELDVATALNPWVEGYFSFAYDSAPPMISGRRIDNSRVRLGKAFINIGNLDRTPFYFTSGQLYVPFGRFSSSMISAPLPLIMSRTIARTVILGYRHQQDTGFYGALFGFRSDTTLNARGVGGINLGYNFDVNDKRGEVGISLISSVNEAGGMQATGGGAGQFAGFGFSRATEAVKKIPAVDVHANINFDAIGLSAEWVSATQAFRMADLNFNQRGAKPQALNVEGAYTFKIQNKPASVGAGYGWSGQALALGLPKHRVAGVFNISIWRDTVESIEVRHDVDYGTNAQANGIGGVISNTTCGSANGPICGTGKSATTVTAQLGIYF